MGRLIDADALKRYEQKIATEAWKMKVKASVETILNQFIDDIDHAPTVDAVPVKHGRWITYELQINGYAHATCECTVCGAFRPHTLFPMKYCSNCGARMDWKDGDT